MFPAFIDPATTANQSSNPGWVLGIFPDGYAIVIPPVQGITDFPLKPSNFFSLGNALDRMRETIRKDGT